MEKKLISSLVIGLLGLALIFSPKVLAEDSSSSGDTVTSVNATDKPEPSESPKPFVTRPFKESSRSAEIRELKKDKLTSLRLKFCQDHEDEINNRVDSLSALVSNILGKFDAIVTRVEQFYQDKVVKSGKTVSNYEALTKDITDKQTAVKDALSNAQADVTNFNCSADNPKGQIGLFRTDMQTVKKALQDYRTSIKNLIVAIRSVVGEGENASPQASETPEASPTPVASPI